MKISDEESVIKSFWSLNFPVEKEACFKGSIDDAAAELESC